jgi:hypothetical protein
VLLGLRHDALVGGDDEKGHVDPRGTGEHVLDEPFVTGDIHHAGLEVYAQGERREAQIDRDAAPLFFLPAIGVHAREGLHQRGLAVVDMAGGADYEAAGVTHARRSQKSMALRGPDSPMW